MRTHEVTYMVVQKTVYELTKRYDINSGNGSYFSGTSLSATFSDRDQVLELVDMLAAEDRRDVDKEVRVNLYMDMGKIDGQG